ADVAGRGDGGVGAIVVGVVVLQRLRVSDTDVGAVHLQAEAHQLPYRGARGADAVRGHLEHVAHAHLAVAAGLAVVVLGHAHRRRGDVRKALGQRLAGRAATAAARAGSAARAGDAAGADS